MYLLLGDPQDPCCLGVRSVLEKRNHPTYIIPNPLAYPWRFTWRLGNAQSASQIALDGEPPIPEDAISGVLVRGTGWIDPSGWQTEDLAYMQTETRAALLAWIWSLECPVVNRYPPAIWYQPRVPLLSWQPQLRRCGLPTLETMLTNVEHEARLFGERLTPHGVAGAVYGPLTSDARYIVADENDWRGLAAMQRFAPVCLTHPHGAVQSVCLVGEQVVWEGELSPEIVLLEPALRNFAATVGLAFLELAVAATPNGYCIVDVEPYPHLERFGETARMLIVEGLADLLTANVGGGHEDSPKFLPGRPL